MRWTHETVAEKAQDFTSKVDFKLAYSGAYKYARKHNIWDVVTAHMNNQRIYWTHETVVEEAKKYDTRNDFKFACVGAYQYAHTTGAMDEICSHMDTLQTTWTHTLAGEEALKYTSRTEFRKGSGRAAIYAVAEGIFDEICSHMEIYNYQDSDMVYLWRIPNTNICKIGVSSVRLGDARIRQVANRMGVDYEILTMCNVPNAFEIEVELHNEYQIAPTTLPKTDGHTEFRVLSDANINEITYYLENIVGNVL